MGGRTKLLGLASAAALASLAILAPGASAVSFSNTGAITMSNGAAADATPDASPINVAGFTGAATVKDISVTLHGFTHTCPNDVGVVLMPPSGLRPIELMSGAGDCTDANNLTFSFDSTSGYMPDTGALASGAYRATSHEARSYPKFGIGTAYDFPGPAAGGSYTLARTFRGIPPDGTWNLIVRDFSTGDGGQIAGGWSLNITTGIPATAGFGAIADGSSVGVCQTYGAPTDVTIPVSGLDGVVGDVAIGFIITHTWVGDLDVQLLAPGGSPSQSVFRRVGAPSPNATGDNSNLNGLYTFFDGAPDSTSWQSVVQAAAGTSDVVQPGRYQAAAPGESAVGEHNTPLSPTFVGVNPNGTWTLRVRDKCSGDTGSVSAANLQINTTPSPVTAPAPPAPPAKKKCKKSKKPKKRSAAAAKKKSKGCKKKQKK
jgi:subtilisin-like proprotein convertase family protein